MNQVLADLLVSAGRIEEKLDTALERLDNHGSRIKRMEGKWAKVTLVITLVSAPVTWAYHRITRKDA